MSTEAEHKVHRDSQPLLHQRGEEIQPFGTLRLLPIALADDVRAESVRLLNRVLTVQTGADVKIAYDPDGLRVTVAVPLERSAT